MKNFIQNNFLTPWKKSNYVGQVLYGYVYQFVES